MTMAVSFTLIGCGGGDTPAPETSSAPALTDAQSVAADTTALAITYGGTDTISSVTQNVTLPTTGSNGTTISWASGTTATISNAGLVTRQGSNEDVVLTATITKNAENNTKVFTLTVIQAAATDADAVLEDKAALVITYGGSDTSTSVTENLTLVTAGSNGTTISWASSASGTVATDGTVNRPAGADESVTLTATIAKGTESDTKVFTVNVKFRVQPGITAPQDDNTTTVKDSNIAIIFNGTTNGATTGTVSFATPEITYTHGVNCTMSFTTTINANDTLTINPTDDFAGVEYSDITISGFVTNDSTAIATYNKADYNFTALDPIDLYLPFNGNSLDEGQNGYTTGEAGGVALTTDRHGVVDRAYDFDGTDDVIYLPNSDGPTFHTHYTIAAWINADTLDHLSGIVSRYHLATNSTYTFRVDTDGALTSAYTKSAADTIIIGSWYHVVIVGVNHGDGNRSITYYVNGVNIQTVTNINYTGNESTLNVGGDYILQEPGARYFDGKIDEVRLYEYNLTDSQIKAIYDVEKP